MLPFLDKKKIVSVIASRRGKKPDIEVNSEMSAPNSDMPSELKDVSHDLLAAIEAKSPIDIAKALQKAFKCCDKEPHKEGPHVEDAS